MIPAPHVNASPITIDQLTSRTFTFRAEPRGEEISDRFIFQKNGFIAGYSHPNESFWRLNGEAVEIVDKLGKATCVMLSVADGTGRLAFSGNFLNPNGDYAKTEILHTLEENASDLHAHIQSFDLFDTLVARRCNDPLQVFRAVEAKCGIAGFATRRHAVEMAMFGRRTYGLDDIYSALIAEATLTEAQAESTRLLELEEEWDMLFPIQEVVARVDAHDIIISDMYLPYAFVSRILKEKCGLDNKLYLSNYGKHHRVIWPSILAEHTIRTHFGDNIHADIVGAAAAGINPTLVSISKWDRTEEILHSAGLAPYAHALRETRLKTFHRDPAIHNVLKAQAAVNIPLMVVGAFWALHCAERFGADKILAASRDCNLWHQMLASTHFARAGMPPVSYFQVSRTLCYDKSTEYEAYLRGRLGARTLLIDVVGTGNSLTHLIDRLELQDRLRPSILVTDPTVSPDETKYDTLVRRDFFQYRVFLEGLNASLDGSAVAAHAENGSVTITAQPNEFDVDMHQAIIASRAVFEQFLVSLERFTPPREKPAPGMLQAAAEALIELLPAHAPKLQTIHREQLSNLARGSLRNVAS
ncbi:hypothetical protein GB927_006850 [Shinella sp. CPCC 100929]|uniref:Uncharacterized protein n=1 Tax=Shinella lacus TaxID=2654216 RepID=A0ABT1R3J7_9HYPH|nr:hypothetical protein [Shinella lacus]MCQ4629749.1 hypothetical protein [Shinella lacus]